MSMILDTQLASNYKIQVQNQFNFILSPPCWPVCAVSANDPLLYDDDIPLTSSGHESFLIDKWRDLNDRWSF